MGKERYKKPDSVKSLENFAFKKLQETSSFKYPVKKKYRDDTSNGLTNCIVDCLNLCGFQAERINSTGRPLDTRQEVSGGLGVATIGTVKWIKSSSQNGTADISATIKGRSVKIEVKCTGTGDNYQSQDQRDYQRKIEQAGGVYVIARDFTGFYKWLQNFVRK